jgi:hypothetical protein
MKFEKEKVKHRVIEDYRPATEVSKPVTHKPLPPSRSSVLFGDKKEEKVIKHPSSEKHPHK